MKQYNLYLHTDKRVNGTNHNNPTFNVDWSFLPSEYQIFNLDIYFYQAGQCCVDYRDTNYVVTNFNSVHLNTIKVSSNLMDIYSYDSSTKCNSFTLGYWYRSENYVDSTVTQSSVSKGSNFVFKFENKIIIKPSGQLTFFIQNLDALMRKNNLYNRLIPNYAYCDINQSNAFSTDCAPFEIVMKFTPIK